MFKDTRVLHLNTLRYVDIAPQDIECTYRMLYAYVAGTKLEYVEICTHFT